MAIAKRNAKHQGKVSASCQMRRSGVSASATEHVALEGKPFCFEKPASGTQELPVGRHRLVVVLEHEPFAKLAMILEARRRQVPVVVCGGAGGKTAVTALRASDLSVTQNDALLSKLRNTLRRQHGYPRAAAAAGKAPRRIPKMGVRAVWFDQPAVLPDLWAKTVTATATATAMPAADAVVGVLAAVDGVVPEAIDGALGGPTAAPQGLSCAGYGSAVMVTATMGMAAAGEAIQWLLTRRFA